MRGIQSLVDFVGRVDLVDNSPDSVVSNVLEIFLLEDGVHLAASSHKREHPDVSTWD